MNVGGMSPLHGRALPDELADPAKSAASKLLHMPFSDQNSQVGWPSRAPVLVHLGFEVYGLGCTAGTLHYDLMTSVHQACWAPARHCHGCAKPSGIWAVQLEGLCLGSHKCM